MIVKTCPQCGRTPIIIELPMNKKYKNGIRRRLCRCPNFCSVIPTSLMSNEIYLEYDGEGDSNAILKEWNIAIDCYCYNKENVYWDNLDEWKNYTH